MDTSKCGDTEGLFMTWIDAHLIEKLTPCKVAVYLVCQSCVQGSERRNFSAKLLSDAASLLLQLTKEPRLSLMQLTRKTEKILPHEVHLDFMNRLRCSTSAEEVILKYSDIFSLPNSRNLIKPSSSIGLFCRRLQVAYARLSLTEILQLHKQMQNYMSEQCLEGTHSIEQPSFSADIEVDDFSTSTDEQALSSRKFRGSSNTHNGEDTGITLDSFGQALRAVQREMYLLHANPAKAMAPQRLDQMVERIREEIPDLRQALLLRYVSSVRVRDLAAAERSLVEYVDWSTMELLWKDRQQQTSGVPSLSRSMRYGALLFARTYRLFGQKERAIACIKESIEKCQESSDSVCLKYAVLELIALEEELKTDNKELTGLVKVLNAEFTHEQHDASPGVSAVATKHFKECSRLFQIIRACTTESIFAEIATVVNNLTGVDRSTEEVAQAALSSHYMAHGYTESAVAVAQRMCACNVGDVHCDYRATDAQLLATLNLVYSYVHMGEFESADRLLCQTEWQYTDSDRWKACTCWLESQRALLGGHLDVAQRAALSLHAFNSFEADLLLALIYQLSGSENEALSVLSRHKNNKALSRRDLARCYSTPYYRLTLVFCDVHIIGGKLGLAEECLTDVLECSTGVCQVMAASATRRKAKILTLRGQYASAQQLLRICRELCISRCGIVEHIAFLKAEADCLMALSVDDSIDEGQRTKNQQLALDLLEAALVKSRCCQASVLEKELLYLAATLQHKLHNTQQRNAYAVRFRELDTELGNIPSFV